MDVGKKIKNLRQACDMTQEELGARANTTKQTIHKYETGIITNIPANKIKHIAEALNTTPAYLMGWEDKEIRPSDDERILSALQGNSDLRNLVDRILSLPPDEAEAKIKAIAALIGRE
ncbi:MAG: helix-turn-helix transcriptional regulator [Bacillota bacterium]|nr:helix-turn-helix transcriptional regulator [Bacillota bacterium]